jgi:hypothetical protein
LASMLLSASTSLFDDPAARVFLTEVERFTGSVFRSVTSAGRDDQSLGDGDPLAQSISDLRATAEPLLDRLPTEVRTALQERPYGANV